MAFNNGEIPLSALAEIPGGRLDGEAARAWNDMRAEIIRRGGPGIRPTGPISSYRDLAGQRAMRALWCGKGHCEKAATPGRSNHGWGRAVDVATTEMEGWLLRLGMSFRWSHDEGARVGESWHFTYIGGYKPRPDPLAALLATERAWVEELEGKGTSRARKQELRRKIQIQLTAIVGEAKKTGWDRRRRRQRFQILRRYVK
jgi:D-alanyl-D-alanine carboxypeptidase-like protein